MNVLIASDTYYPHVNGASYFTQRLAQWMAGHSHEVWVVAPSPKLTAQTYTHEDVTIMGVPSVSLLVHQNFRMAIPWRLTNAVQTVITQFAPDVVHIQDHFMIGRAVARAAKQAGLPLVGTNHFMPENFLHYFHLPSALAAYARQRAWRDFRRVFAQADVITTPTQTAAKLLHEVGLGKEVRVLSCGINRALFRPREAGEDVRKKWNLSSAPHLLYVGRLDREKNIDLILRALARLALERRPHFLIAGRGADEKRLQEITQALQLQPHVRFLGFVPNEDLPQLYNLASCFIIAGTAELQSLVTLEAMASGLPIIAVNAMALPELVHHGQNGYLFEKGNAAQLAEQIEKVMSDPALREAMGRKSLEMIEKHDLEHVAREYEKLYQMAVKK